MSPERPADPDFAAGRRRKAIQFLTAAEEIMDLADDLNQLLALKTKAGYTHRPVSTQERTQAGRRARTLVDTARTLPL